MLVFSQTLGLAQLLLKEQFDVEKLRVLLIQTIEMLVQPVAKGKFQISITTYKPTNLETITLKFTRIIVKTRNCNISSSSN